MSNLIVEGGMAGMAGVSPSPVLYSPAQQALPNPSPFANSSEGWSTWRSSHHPTFLFTLFFRFLAFLFSAISAIIVAAPILHTSKGSPPFFGHYTELRYSFSAAILASLYNFGLLFKDINEIAFKGLVVSGPIYDYMAFVFDQLLAYMLMSSSTASAIAIHRIQSTDDGLKKPGIASVAMSVLALISVAACALISGYKLCKRLIW